jgi:hypothetical protein
MKNTSNWLIANCKFAQAVLTLSKKDCQKAFKSAICIGLNLSYYRDNKNLMKLTGWASACCKPFENYVDPTSNPPDDVFIPMAKRVIAVYEEVSRVCKAIKFDENQLGSMAGLKQWAEKFKAMGLTSG